MEEVAARARASGHLMPIPTVRRTFEKHGVRWIIRMAPSLVKSKTEQTTPARNPFLPPEPELFVADLSETHLCVLNKFNVVDHHLVIVTRAFEHQDTPLTERDFEATARCLDELGGLAFYNGGRLAGASQPHKHMQLVPRVDDEVEGVPIEPLLGKLPFRSAHADHQHDLHRTYRSLIESFGLAEPFPYNMLLTKRWMLIVPRSQEAVEGIQINSLGYAGAFLAKTEDECARIEKDPLEVLALAGLR
jgi:ATP adenylyltransferase